MHLASVSDLWRSQANARLPVYFVPADACVCNHNKCSGGHDDVSTKVEREWRARMEGDEGCWGVKEEWLARDADQERYMPPAYLVPWTGTGNNEYLEQILAIASGDVQE